MKNILQYIEEEKYYLKDTKEAIKPKNLNPSNQEN